MRENRGRQNTKYFEFRNIEEMNNFIMLYEDLFVPYSVNSDVYRFGDTVTKNTALKGYVLCNNIFMKCNLEPEGLVEILESKSFEKIKKQKGVYKYVMREAV